MVEKLLSSRVKEVESREPKLSYALVKILGPMAFFKCFKSSWKWHLPIHSNSLCTETNQISIFIPCSRCPLFRFWHFILKRRNKKTFFFCFFFVSPSSLLCIYYIVFKLDTEFLKTPLICTEEHPRLYGVRRFKDRHVDNQHVYVAANAVFFLGLLCGSNCVLWP